jgi:hypothetical protein
VPEVGGGQYCTWQQLSVWQGTKKQFSCTGKSGHLSNKQISFNLNVLIDRLVNVYIRKLIEFLKNQKKNTFPFKSKT